MRTLHRLLLRIPKRSTVLAGWIGVVAAAWFCAEAYAGCNLIPGTAKVFNGAVGATNRPFAAPGEPVEVLLRGCDTDSLPFPATPDDQLVTIVFTPPDATAPHAVVLTAASDCTTITPRLAACESTLGGTAECVAGLQAGLFVADRNDGRHLGFRFPNAEPLFGTPLGGPVTIAVSTTSDPLPCDLASVSCTERKGLVACVDDLYANDGSCGTAIPNDTFPHFTALPRPNDYRTACFGEAPPCTGTSSETRVALDSAGNLLMPIVWGGVNVHAGGAPIARLLRTSLRPPLPVTLPDRVFIGSFTPEGGRLATIFEPQLDPTVVDPNTVVLFGKTDAPYTILRLARRHGTCQGGGHDGERCAEFADCPGGVCVDSCLGAPATACTMDGDCGGNGPCGTLFDLLPLAQGGGIVTVPRASTAGICQGSVGTTCTSDGDCAPGDVCVNYALEVQSPAPLQNLQQSLGLNAFTIDEGIGLRDRNGDGDTVDSVVTLRDRTSGVASALGAAAGCGIAGTPEGRAVVRIQDPPFSYPAVAAEGNVEAFLESELGGNYCVQNGDSDRLDAILRVFRLGVGEVTASLSPRRAVASTPLVNGRSLAVSNHLVFYRVSESDAAGRTTSRVNLGPGDAQSTGVPFSCGLGTVSADGTLVAFSTGALDLLGPGADTNGARDIFVRNQQTHVTERVSIGPGGLQANDESFNPSLSSEGRYVIFQSAATNLLGVGNDTNGFLDVFVHDRQTGITERVDVGPGGIEANDEPFEGPSISGNGRFAAFDSFASNLLEPGEDGNAKGDVFIRDRTLGFTERVSVGPSGVEANGDSSIATVSDDGRFAAFSSDATNLLGPGMDQNGTAVDIFVRDRVMGQTELVSVASDGQQGNGSSYVSIMSSGGRFVAFVSQATNLVANDTNGVADVFVRDRLLGTTERVSVGPGGVEANDYSYTNGISSDGLRVSFTSLATNLLGTGKDTNGTQDVFVHDRRSGVTERVSTGPADVAANGTSYCPYISGDGQTLAFYSEATNLLGPGGDTNGAADWFVRRIDPADPLSVDTTFHANGSLTDDVLEVFDAFAATVTTLCPASVVTVANGIAAFLRPESATGTVACPGGSLNPPDADSTDAVVHLWTGGPAATNLERAASGLAMSAQYVAALVSECGTAGATTNGCTTSGTDQNADGDAGDAVVAVTPVAGANPSSWVNVAAAADALAVVGSIVGFVTPEAAQGDAELNADDDATDRVLQVYDAETATVVLGAATTPRTRAAEDFVLGEETITACGIRQLVAFRTREAAEDDTNLNGTTGTPLDGDTDDDVLMVYDAVTHTLRNVGQAVTPCLLQACDPQQPYRVSGSKVKFLTLEPDQGGQDLSGEGSHADLVLQVYDFCGDTVTVIGRVAPTDGQNPLDENEDSGVIIAPAGRCDAGASCDPLNDECGDGAYCQNDTCDAVTGTCVLLTGRPCANDAACRRCLLLEPGTCLADGDCPPGTTCQEMLVAASTATTDADGDGVPDEQDNCLLVANSPQADGDADGVGDACDAQVCGNSVQEVGEECDDGNAVDGDRCSMTCVGCPATPLAGCRAPVVSEKASLQLKDKADDTKDQLTWKWSNGAATAKADFGQPTSTDRYQLCIYDQSGLQLAARVPAAGICAKGKLCWQEKPKGFQYKDGALTPDGIAQLTLGAGVDGKAKIQVKAKGNLLPMPASLSALASPVTAQLVNRGNGTCWQAIYSAPFDKQDAGQFADKAN